jgi:hypothetical protein
MATVTNKIVVLSVEGKVKVILAIENGKNKSDLCGEFGFVNRTFQKTWKNILKNY